MEEKKVELKATVPSTIKPKKPLNRIIGVILTILVLYCGPISLMMYRDVFAWVRSFEFICLVLGLAVLYFIYALANPDKYEIKVPVAASTIIKTPADCAVCGKAFDRKNMHELSASHKLLCNECFKLMKK